MARRVGVVRVGSESARCARISTLREASRLTIEARALIRAGARAVGAEVASRTSLGHLIHGTRCAWLTDARCPTATARLARVGGRRVSVASDTLLAEHRAIDAELGDRDRALGTAQEAHIIELKEGRSRKYLGHDPRELDLNRRGARHRAGNVEHGRDGSRVVGGRSGVERQQRAELHRVERGREGTRCRGHKVSHVPRGAIVERKVQLGLRGLERDKVRKHDRVARHRSDRATVESGRGHLEAVGRSRTEEAKAFGRDTGLVD